MQRMRQHNASVCSAYDSKLLAQTANTLAKSCKNEFLQAYAAHTVANCQRMRRMQQHFASVCGAGGSTLLAYAAHAIATYQRRRHIRQQIASKYATYSSTLLAEMAHAVAKTKGYTRRPRISVDGACGSILLAYAASAVANLLAQTAHTVAICQRMRRMRQQIARVDGAYARKLLAYTAHAVAKPCKMCVLLAQTAHTVANCKCMGRMQQHYASVDGAYGSNLLAQTAHAVAKTKWPVSHPSVKNLKKFISALKSPTYIDFMIKNH